MDFILRELAYAAFAMLCTGSRYQYLQTNTFLSYSVRVPKDSSSPFEHQSIHNFPSAKGLMLHVRLS